MNIEISNVHEGSFVELSSDRKSLITMNIKYEINGICYGRATGSLDDTKMETVFVNELTGIHLTQKEIFRIHVDISLFISMHKREIREYLANYGETEWLT